jgi:polyhydroxybutyrate depolymerase
VHLPRWGRGRSVARLALIVVLATAALAGAGLYLAHAATPGSPAGTSAQPAAVRTAAGAAPAGPVAMLRTLDIAGTARTYRAFVPTGPPQHWPLLVVLHGRGQGWRTAVDQSGFLGLVRRHQAVLVFPDGVGRSWNAGEGCCGLAGRRRLPDVEFVTSVLADALTRLPVDPSRAYLVGYSNGGKLAYLLDCTHPTLFAGLATYGAAPLRACPTEATPTPFLIAAGERDTILPFRGAPRAVPPTPSISTALDWLRDHDGCLGAPSTTRIGHVVSQDWTRCRDGSEVRSVVYGDIGHAWPGAAHAGNPALAGLMWQFLIVHRRPGQNAPVVTPAVHNS